MSKQLISFGIALISVPVVLLIWTIVAHNLRIGRVRKLAHGLPTGTRERILARIADAARGSSVCTLLVPLHAPRVESVGSASSRSDVASSHFGGMPYGEAGDPWPAKEEGGTEPAEFLIQVRLDDPLPAPWRGRLIAVFLKFDITQTLFVYTDPAPDKCVQRLGGDAGASPECRFLSLPIPTPHLRAISSEPEAAAATLESEDEWQLPYDPSRLIDAVSGLREELSQFTNQPIDLLTHWMLTERHGYELDLSDIVQMGGRPEWVQGDPGSPCCDECGQPMRFLFQFGDLSGQCRLGDAGVCFVFGCDAHPDYVQSLVQMC